MFSTHQHLRRFAVGVLTAGAVLTAAACGSSGGTVAGGNPSDGATKTSSTGPTGAAPAQLTEIKVINTAGKNLEQAQDYGFFAKYGLKVDIQHLANGAQVLAALQGGSGVIGYADTYAGLNAIAQGFKITLVANNNSNDGKKQILVKADSDIKTPADLVGKTIALPPVPQHTVNTRGFLTANGVDPNKVKLLYTQGQSDLPPALQNGTADAIFSSYDVLYQNQGQEGAYNFRAIGNGDSSAWSTPGATSAAWWSTEEYATSHQDVENEFDNALHDFYRWLNSLKSEQVAAINLKYNQVDWVKEAGGDPTKLANLAYVASDQVAPFDFAATQSWYDLGLKYAADKIKPGVDLHKAVFSSALQPEPSGDYPAAATAFASGS